MVDLPLGRIAAFVPEFAVKDLPLGRTLILMRYYSQNNLFSMKSIFKIIIGPTCPETSAEKKIECVTSKPNANITF